MSRASQIDVCFLWLAAIIITSPIDGPIGQHRMIPLTVQYIRIRYDGQVTTYLMIKSKQNNDNKSVK